MLDKKIIQINGQNANVQNDAGKADRKNLLSALCQVTNTKSVFVNAQYSDMIPKKECNKIEGFALWSLICVASVQVEVLKQLF